MSEELNPEQQEYVEQLRDQILDILRKVREEDGVDVPVEVKIQKKEEDDE